MTHVQATAPRGRYARGDRTKDRIAAAAVEIIDARGHEAVTTADVAERADVAPPTVIYHFATRDHLLVGAMRYIQAVSAEHAHAFDPDLDVDLEALTRSARAQHPHRARLLEALRGMAVTPGHPAEAFFRERDVQLRNVWTSLIARRIAIGSAPADLDAEEAAVLFIAAFEGLTQAGLVSSDLDVGGLVATAFLRITRADTASSITHHGNTR